MGLEADKRQEKIIELLRKNSRITVAELARNFQVSEVTVRRDMDSLAKAGKVLRTYGGAISSEKIVYEFSFREKLQKNIKEKEKIAELSASLIKEGDRILMDTGTTTLQVAKCLSLKKNITIVTASLPIVSALSGNSNIEIILLGGEFQHNGFDLVGSITEKQLKNIHVDKSFQGVAGIDLKQGFFTTDFRIARISELMIKAAEEVIIVADHTKFNRKSFVLFGKLEEADTIITSKDIDKKIVETLRKRGIKVLLA